MSQVDVEQMKKRVSELMSKAMELRKTVSELYEVVKDSELARRVEKLSEVKDTLSYFIFKKAGEFAIYLHDPVGENIGVLVKRLSFERVIHVPRGASIFDIYDKFFADQSVLETLVSNLVVAMMSLAEGVKKNVDVLSKISELERNIEFMSRELDDIEEKLEDP
jgi:regulator of replication initiation timing